MFRWKGLLVFLSLVAVLAVMIFLIEDHSYKKLISKPTTIGEEYDGDIEKVDKITVRNERTGDFQTYTDKKAIQNWLASIKNIKFKPVNNDEVVKGGWGYRVTLYADSSNGWIFSPNELNGGHYNSNREVFKRIDDLYHSK